MNPCTPEVFLYGFRRLLLVLHAGGSIVLIGASTHHALQMRHYLAGRFHRQALEKTYAKVVSVAYVATFILGALLYPSYRVHVRGLWLDRHAPEYAGLFDVKEVFASLTITVAVALGALALTLRPAETPALTRVYAVMSFIVCAVVWLNVIAGILVVSVRGVG
ncbi:Hypothetical protein A7982_10926 [Minicystis rosea]|nr:Hypothetical protein A7982_10926 [Minicystis rosea]